eukprot:TRINITY_DN30484_c0_g1_i1.p2 TRINITY_DN30484_c0_g1~~TRINITY_DN30484_c0_g1_i1.p2  ORF type:complete len:142 (-),score=15.20 TRINITY_DN30484_c0_g1_i1:220-645(-)
MESQSQMEKDWRNKQNSILQPVVVMCSGNGCHLQSTIGPFNVVVVHMWRVCCDPKWSGPVEVDYVRLLGLLIIYDVIIPEITMDVLLSTIVQYHFQPGHVPLHMLLLGLVQQPSTHKLEYRVPLDMLHHDHTPTIVTDLDA